MLKKLKTPHCMFGALLEVEMLKKYEKVNAIVSQSTFWRQHGKDTPRSHHFWTSHRFFQAQCVLHLAKNAQNGRFCTEQFQKTMRHGTFEDVWRGFAKVHFAWQAVLETSPVDMSGGPGADFLRGVAFWSIRSSGLLRWFCVTGAALRMTWHHFFVAGAVLSTGGLEKSQNALVRSC